MENKEFAPGAVMDLIKSSEIVKEDTSELEQKYASSLNNSEEDTLSKTNKYPRKTRTIIREYKKIGRNETCPCGSGKKYKNCCLNYGKYEQMHELTVIEANAVKYHEKNYSDIQKIV